MSEIGGLNIKRALKLMTTGIAAIKAIFLNESVG